MTSSPSPEENKFSCPFCGATNRLGHLTSPLDKTRCTNCGCTISFEANQLKMITLSRSNFNELFVLTDEQYKRFESLQVDIDFGEVEFISSATIAKLIVLAKNGKMFGFRVALTNVNPTIDEVFRITRLDRLLTIKS